jgi:hypothetical protein
MNPIRAESSQRLFDNTKPAKGPLPVQPTIKWDERGYLAGMRLIDTRNLDCVKDIFPEAYPHALLMYDRLRFHKEHYDGDFLDPIFMVGKSLMGGPAWTNDYLDAWKLARFRMMNMQFSTEPEPPKVNISMTDYNSCYLGYFFIFWEEEVDDYQNMFQGVPEIQSETLQNIEDIIAEMSENLLSDKEIMEDPPIEYIWRPIATGGFDGEVTKPEWDIEFDNPHGDIFSEILVSARAVAPKRPGEVRDIGITTPGSLRFHRKIMYLLQKACKRIKGCPYGQSQDHIRSIVHTIGKRNGHFYMRDYTKSGMTIPHAVQEAVFRGFYRRRPDLGEAAARFFKDQQLWVKTESGDRIMVRPETGSPLGLFVEGYTLFQYALHELNMRECDFPSSDFMFSATNDDMVTGSTSLAALQSYVDVDQRNNSELGMQYKDTKSGISEDAFVYCEEYWQTDHVLPKDCLSSIAIIGAKYCINTFHAKEYCYAVLLSNSGGLTPQVDQAIREVQVHHGPEFHTDEFRWPFLFGGWLPQIKEGIDHSIEWFDGDLRAEAGYWASRTRINKKGQLGDKPHLAIGRLLEVTLLTEPENVPDWVDLIPLLGTRRTLESHFRKAQSHPGAIRRDYELLARLRKESYLRFLKGDHNHGDIREGWIERHPSTYIPSNMPHITTEDSFTRINVPRFGFKDNSLEMWLSQMQHKGYLSYRSTKPLVGTQIYLATKGLSSQCSYPFIPVSEKGISEKVLAIQPKGLIDFFERTGKTIIAIGADDQPLKESELWGYMPWASLLTTCRMWNWAKTRGYPMNLDTLIKISEIHKQMSRLSSEDAQAFSQEEIPQTISGHSEILAEMVRDVIRDWCPDADAVISSMVHRLVPSSEVSDQERERLLAFYRDDDAYTIGRRPPAEALTDAHSDAESEEVYNPWHDLGVT